MKSIIMKPILSSDYSKSHPKSRPKCITPSVDRSCQLPSKSPLPQPRSERVSIINHQDTYITSRNLKYYNIYDREFIRNLNRKRVLYQRLEEPFRHYKEKSLISQTPDIFINHNTPEPFEIKYIPSLKQYNTDVFKDAINTDSVKSSKPARPRVSIIIPKVKTNL
jgi:hypothetical protein